jgi:hypothetical protein
MKIKKVNEINEELIKKIDDFLEEDLDNYKGRESFGNAQYFMMSFLNSGDDNRRKNNPHSITYERMFKEFGEPNFQTDYNESDWWILEYKGEIYSVDVSTHEEGSMICKLFDNVVYRIYDKKFNQDAQDFYNQLFKQI